ncbi:MAG TPA: hypothetical protein VGS28_03615 [Candidatus Saccharimonadales bacterium]|nr:hypothetical protein [Candidatus Saccharimonadales bacterium]
MRTIIKRHHNKQKRHFFQRGDTIIEVLFSVVILGIVFTTAYSLTDFGLNAEQSSIERTQLSGILQTQAEALRTIRDESQAGSPDYNAVAAGIWTNILNNYATSTVPSNYTANSAPTRAQGCTPTAGSNPMTINTPAAPTPVSLSAGKKTNATIGESYWVEAYQTSPKYIDFDIRGCWEPLGGSTNQPIQVVVVIERLIVD